MEAVGLVNWSEQTIFSPWRGKPLLRVSGAKLASEKLSVKSSESDNVIVFDAGIVGIKF